LEFLNTIWIFFQDQILGMKFLNLLIGDVLSVAGVDRRPPGRKYSIFSV